MSEADFRRLADETLDLIDAAFETVDPDLAEADRAQSGLVITFRQAHELIVAPQAPLRQLWLAFHDRAWHFSRDGRDGRWVDDRGQGVDLLALLVELTSKHAGVSLRLRPGARNGA